MARRRDTWRPTVRTETIGQVMVLTVSGRLGEAGVREPTLRAALTEAQAARSLVVDLSAVDYLSSPGLRLLEELVAHASARGVPLAFCGLTEPVRIAVDLAEMRGRLPCVATRAEALGLLG